MKILLAFLVSVFCAMAQTGASQVSVRTTSGDVNTNVQAVMNSAFLYDMGYTTLAKACTAATANSKTLVLTKTWSSLTTQTLGCNISALTGGILQPAAAQTVTLSGFFDGDLTQHFDVSVGGGFASTSDFSMKAMYPQWFGATGDGTTDDTAAFQAAYNNLFALNSTTLTVPRGRYVITPTTGIGITLPNGVTTACQNAQTKTSDMAEAWFLAGSDNMVMFQNVNDTVNNNHGMYMYGCGFDLGGVSHGYTAVDGLFARTVAFVDVEKNVFIGVPANHTAIKGGGLLYADFYNNWARGSGRIFDILNLYSSSSSYYGVNVGTFKDNACSGCSQGYRISGQFNFENNDSEGAINARAAFDFSESGIATNVKMLGGYVEMSTGSVTPGKAIYVSNGVVDITGFECQYTTTAGTGDTCLYIDKYDSLGLFSLDVHGNKFVGADYGIYLDQIPVQPTSSATSNSGSALLAGNGFISIKTNKIQTGSDITLSDFQKAGCGMMSIPGTGNMFACGVVTPITVANSYPIDVSRCAGGVCVANANGTVSVANTMQGERFSIISGGGAVVVPNASFNLACGCDLTLPIHRSLNFVVDSSGVIREADFNSRTFGGITGTKTVRASGGASDCTLIYSNGVLTGGTC